MVSILVVLSKLTKEDTMKKKTAYQIVTTTRELLYDTAFRDKCKSRFQDFSRNCLISLGTVITVICNLLKKTLQVELIDFGEIVDGPYISKQAFSAARKKLLPVTFYFLNNKLVHEYYNDNIFKTFNTYRVIAIDGSTLQLPDSPSIRRKYGVCRNQRKKERPMPMARISHAYDPFSGLILDAMMRSYATPERDMVYEHILNISPSNRASDLYLLDRGYPSTTLIWFLYYYGKDFIMRCSAKNWLSEITEVLQSGARDAVIEITPGRLSKNAKAELLRRLPGINLLSSIKLRVLIIDLDDGKKEILITSLIDNKRFDYSIFKDLYFLRWGGEENYKFCKVRVEIENFSGMSPSVLEQDFYATIFISNIRALIAEEAQAELDRVQKERERIDPKKKPKYERKINKNISIGILKNKLITFLLGMKVNLMETFDRLKKLMLKNTISVRPGRKYERVKRNNRKYPMNARRAL